LGRLAPVLRASELEASSRGAELDLENASQIIKSARWLAARIVIVTLLYGDVKHIDTNDFSRCRAFVHNSNSQFDLDSASVYISPIIRTMSIYEQSDLSSELAVSIAHLDGTVERYHFSLLAGLFRPPSFSK
jgi:hypothetical protein